MQDEKPRDKKEMETKGKKMRLQQLTDYSTKVLMFSSDKRPNINNSER